MLNISIPFPNAKFLSRLEFLCTDRKAHRRAEENEVSTNTAQTLDGDFIHFTYAFRMILLHPMQLRYAACICVYVCMCGDNTFLGEMRPLPEHARNGLFVCVCVYMRWRYPFLYAHTKSIGGPHHTMEFGVCDDDDGESSDNSNFNAGTRLLVYTFKSFHIHDQIAFILRSNTCASRLQTLEIIRATAVSMQTVRTHHDIEHHQNEVLSKLKT